MRSGSPHSGDLSQDSGGRSVHRSPVTRMDAEPVRRSRGAEDRARLMVDVSRSSRQFYNALSASSIGLELGLSVVLCVLLGLWLDGKLGTQPWLMLAGLGLGLAAGFRSVLRSVRRAERAGER